MNKQINISRFRIWLLASRPKTLPAAFVPVFVGSSLAVQEGKFNIRASVIALLCSILIQIGTNFTNDLYDFYKGADDGERKGPLRVLTAGLVTPGKMKFAIFLVFGLTFLMGLYLVYLQGYVIFIIGVLSILAGLAYTAGPFPLAYNGLGDIFVFIFFGLFGTAGTYYLHSGCFTIPSIIASIPVGALITNILVVNNYRDIDEDRKVGKNTLAVLLGRNFARYQYFSLLLISFIAPFILYSIYNYKYWIFLPYVTFPIAIKLMQMVIKNKGEELNKTLELTARFSALFGVLFSVGAAL
jgi:1,4-dihydroxy-2-naphthoate octaprenyltransferase